MQISKIGTEAYLNARSFIENTIGTSAENYKVLMFLDPSLYDSTILQITHSGSPRAIISANELEILQKLKEEDYVANGMDLFYGSKEPRILMPASRIETGKEKIFEAKMVHLLAKSVLVENTKSRFPVSLEKLFDADSIIYNLFANNVFEFVKERNAPWIWQYFQDFTATMRILSLYQLDEFYIPPTSIKSASMFYNYLAEIKSIVSERAKAVTSTPLHDLMVNGFADVILNYYLDQQDKDVHEMLLPHLKSNLGQPSGVLGSIFYHEHESETIPEIFEHAINLKNDYDLLEPWNRTETKKLVDERREKLSQESFVWHAAKESYWSDLWPLRASNYDKLAAYIGKIQRRKYKSFGELLVDSPLVTSHGRIQLRDREVSVMSIQEDTVGQEQLLVLRNHLQAKKDTFTTPLPGLPDVIVFKKYAGMHVASYLGVADSHSPHSYPKSPYDLPLVVRAVQVTRKKDAYLSEERDETVKMESVNYENLSKLTEPQYRAIRYLIRQSEVVQ